MHSYEARAIYKSREAGSGDSRRATARVPTPLHTTPALTRLCWRMRLRGDSHPPAGRPRGSPLLWTGLESRFPRGIVGATLVVARLDRSMLVSFCIPSVIRQVGSGCGLCSRRLHSPHPLPTWRTVVGSEESSREET